MANVPVYIGIAYDNWWITALLVGAGINGLLTILGLEALVGFCVGAASCGADEGTDISILVQQFLLLSCGFLGQHVFTIVVENGPQSSPIPYQLKII